MLNTADKIIKHKAGLLNLAAELGNVSIACRISAIRAQSTLPSAFSNSPRHIASIYLSLLELR